MSDTYDINGVKVTPVGGGYYDLEHSSLSEPERVRGKETADNRAADIAKDAEPADGRMEPQGELHVSGATGEIIAQGDTRSEAERAQERDFAQRGDDSLDPTAKPAQEQREVTQEEKDRETAQVMDQVRPPAPKAADADDKDALIAALRAEAAEERRRREELERSAAATVTSVQAVQPPAPSPLIAVPRQFTGQMSEEGKAALKAAGQDYSTIVLEENDSIPPTGLFISHNGRSYMIKPGEEVDVPDFLIAILDDAVMSAPIVDTQSQKVLGYRNRSKYPYRRVNR